MHCFIAAGEVVDDVETLAEAGALQTADFAQQLRDGYDHLCPRTITLTINIVQ